MGVNRGEPNLNSLLLCLENSQCLNRLLILFIVVLLLTACSPLNQFAAYRPPLENRNIGIEVILHRSVPYLFELKFDGQYVTEIKWPPFDYTATASGKYNGKRVEMTGKFYPGGTYVIDVYFAEARAANFIFQ